LENPAAATEEQLLAMLRQFLADQFKLVVHREAKHGTKLVFRGYSLQRLADFLATTPVVQRPVRDMTGLSGRFDSLSRSSIRRQGACWTRKPGWHDGRPSSATSMSSLDFVSNRRGGPLKCS